MRNNIINIKEIDNEFENKMKMALDIENIECKISLSSKYISFLGNGDIVQQVKRIIEENGYEIL